MSKKGVEILGLIKRQFPNLSIQSNHESEQGKTNSSNSMLHMLMLMGNILESNELEAEDWTDFVLL